MPKQEIVQVINSDKDLEEFLSNIRKHDKVVLDIETTGLDSDTHELILVGWYFGGRAYILPYTLKGYETLVRTQVLTAIKEIFSRKDLTLIGHNIKFDLRFLAKYGLEYSGKVFDTLVGWYLLDENTDLGLKDLVKEVFGFKMKVTAEVDFSNIPQLLCYAKKDVYWTQRLYEEEMKRLVKYNLLDIMERVEMPLLKVLLQMELEGMPVNVRYLRGLKKRLEKLLSDTEGRIYIAIGHSFNIGSSKQLGEVLYDELKLPPQKMTTGGTKGIPKRSTDAEALELLSGKHPIMKEILAYRRYSKLLSTYVCGLLDRAKLHDDNIYRVHGYFNQARARTARLSSSDPNLQNIIIDKEYDIRKAFYAPDGYKLLDIDYSQVELRIIAHLAKDASMRKLFLRGGDIHKNVGDEVGVDRSAAKAINFGLMYGMGAWALAKTLNVSESVAEEYIAKYFSKFRSIKPYQDRLIISARKKGYIETIIGRRRRIPEITSLVKKIRGHAERQAKNSVVQTSAADVIKMAMVKLSEELKGSDIKMISQVHDELLFLVPENRLEYAKLVAKEIMERPFKTDFYVPLEVDMKVVQNWSQAKE